MQHQAFQILTAVGEEVLHRSRAHEPEYLDYLQVSYDDQGASSVVLMNTISFFLNTRRLLVLFFVVYNYCSTSMQTQAVGVPHALSPHCAPLVHPNGTCTL